MMKTNTLDFDAQALREKILDLAMRGKLVPQDPDDEPASVLLKKIKAEKEELIKEKKIKKSKPLAPIAEDEKPFEIPDSWEWVRLGDVINLISGRDIPKKLHINKPANGSMPYITGASNIDDNGKITITEWVDNPSVIVKNGTLLLSVKGTIGKVAVLNIPKAHIARQIMGLENVYKLNLEFQKYFLEDYIEELKSKAKSMIPGISRDDLLSAVIPFPPLAEQSRIAAKIAQLFALLRKVESSIQQYAKLKVLLKSKMLDLAMRGELVEQDPHDEPASVLLEKIKAEKAELVKEKKIKRSKALAPITDDERPFEIPDSWEWARLGEITIIKGGKRVPKGEKLTSKKDYKPYIRVADMESQSVNLANIKYATKSIYNQISNYTISSQDIYFSIAGTIGKVGKIPHKLDGALLTENAAKLEILNQSLTNDIFLVNILESNEVKEQHKRILSKVAQPKLALTKLRNTIVPLPPLAEQSRIVSKVEQLFDLINQN